MNSIPWGPNGLREGDVLREEAVAGVDGIHAGDLGGADDVGILR